MIPQESMETKLCAHCGQQKPLKDFKRRSGRRRGATARRGRCSACSDQLKSAEANNVEVVDEANADAQVPVKKKRKRRRRKKNAVQTVDSAPARVPFVPPEIPLEKLRAIGLKPTWGGFIRMRGKTDNGRKWYQEIDTYLAYVLVTEHAAEVVNRHTIRRIYSNKEFRKLILERDHYTCYYCKQYGDTIDHLLPRAKGGHTTPDNCVCACNLCNQSKADKDLEDFMNILELG